MANVSKINFNGEAIDIKDIHAREQIQHLTTDNYTADVTGDYTVNAGNIAMSSANATMHTTADRTIDTDGNDSVHIEGASTLNVGGLRTETFAGDKTETVTGTATEKYNNVNTTVTETATEKYNNINTTVTGKWMVNTPTKNFSMADVATGADVSTAINDAKRNLKTEDKYLIIADSYGLQSLTGANNWPTSLAKLLHLKDENYEIIAHGSIGFVGMVEEVGRTFESSMLESNKWPHDEVTKIIIGGGANDLDIDANKLTDAVKHLMNTAKTSFPNATVYVAGVSYLSDIRKRTAMFKKIAVCYSSVNLYGGVYIPNVQNAILDTNLLADGVHPKKDSVANEYIANAIKCGLEGAYERTIYEKPVTITPYENVSITDMKFNVSLVDNTFLAKCKGESTGSLPHTFRIDLGTEKNIVGLNDLGTYESMFPNGGGLENLIPCYIICRTARNPVGNIYGAIYLSANVFGIFVPPQTTASDFNPQLMASTLHVTPLATYTRLY